MPTYKLTYFNARGLAECARYMFKLKGQDFEDVRLSREQPEFNEAKARAPFGQLPILEVEGMDTPICQSRAIERYIARKFGQSGIHSNNYRTCHSINGQLTHHVKMLQIFWVRMKSRRRNATSSSAASMMSKMRWGQFS